MRPALALLLLVLVAATGYEAALAAGAVSIGSLPGAGAPWSTEVVGAALAAAFAGSLLCLVVSIDPDRGAAVLCALVAVASAVFAAVHLYTDDPYFAPEHRRMSDGGAVAPAWVFGLVSLAVIFGIAAARQQRFSIRLLAPLVWVTILTALLEGAGH